MEVLNGPALHSWWQLELARRRLSQVGLPEDRQGNAVTEWWGPRDRFMHEAQLQTKHNRTRMKVGGVLHLDTLSSYA